MNSQGTWTWYYIYGIWESIYYILCELHSVPKTLNIKWHSLIIQHKFQNLPIFDTHDPKTPALLKGKIYWIYITISKILFIAHISKPNSKLGYFFLSGTFQTRTMGRCSIWRTTRKKWRICWRKKIFWMPCKIWWIHASHICYRWWFSGRRIFRWRNLIFAHWLILWWKEKKKSICTLFISIFSSLFFGIF